MSVRSEGLAQLASIMQDETAPRNVRDAAKLCRNAIACHLKPARDLMFVVQEWIGKQNQQDRFGK